MGGFAEVAVIMKIAIAIRILDDRAKDIRIPVEGAMIAHLNRYSKWQCSRADDIERLREYIFGDEKRLCIACTFLMHGMHQVHRFSGSGTFIEQRGVRDLQAR